MEFDPVDFTGMAVDLYWFMVMMSFDAVVQIIHL